MSAVKAITLSSTTELQVKQRKW